MIISISPVDAARWSCRTGSEEADVFEPLQLQQSHETLREDQGMLGQGVILVT